MSRTTWIDSDYTDESVNPKVVNGVKMGEGDGTVSLLSLGAMCVEGWQRKRWNPSGIPVITVEVNRNVFSISWPRLILSYSYPIVLRQLFLVAEGRRQITSISLAQQLSMKSS